MAWKLRFGGDSPRPALEDVTFDTIGFVKARSGRDAWEWQNAAGDRIVARIERAAPDRPLPAWTLENMRATIRQRAMDAGGGLISVTADRVGPVPLIIAIRKVRSGVGFAYDGSVMIRFGDAAYEVTIDAREERLTGARESMAAAILFQVGELRVPVPPPGHPRGAPLRMPDLTGDPYDSQYDESAPHSKSDDERLDEIISGHPLSRVRGWLARARETLAVAPDLHGDLVAPGIDAGPSEDRYRMSALSLAILAMHAGRPDLVERFIVDEIAPGGAEPALDVPRAGDMLIFLGVAREALGRLDAAAWAHERAVAAFRAAHGEDHAQTIRAKSNLARVYAAQDRCAEAESLLDVVVPAFEASGDRSELALALHALGRVRQSQSRHVDALALLERSLLLFEGLEHPPISDCVRVLRDIARSAEATGDDLRRARALKRAEAAERAPSTG